MSESKIKLLILMGLMGPSGAAVAPGSRVGKELQGEAFWPPSPRSPRAGACAIPSLGLLINLMEVAAPLTMALMASAASAAGGSAPVSCCAPASSKTP